MFRLTPIVLVVSIASCGQFSYIRPVSRTPTGGEVALLASIDAARTQARNYMNGQCPNGFDIVEEREEVVGTERTSQTSTNSNRSGTSGGSTTTESTNNKTEWRMKYQCREAPAAAASAVGSGAPVAAPAASGMSL